MTNHPPCSIPDAARVRSMLTRGFGPAKIARHLNIPRSRVGRIVEETPLPSGLVYLADFVRDHNLPWSHIRVRMVEGDVKTTRYGGRQALNRMQAADLLADYRDIPTLESLGRWLTRQQVAAEWHCAPERVSDVRRKLEAAGVEVRWLDRVRGVAGSASRYHEGDVLAAAKGLTPVRTELPRGLLGSRELADMVGQSWSCPRDWASSGCPVERLRVYGKVKLAFKPVEVLTWLEQQQGQHWPVSARMLRTALKLPERAPQLTPTQQRVLGVIEARPGTGRLRVAAELAVAYQTLKMPLLRLERLGYIRAEAGRSPSNRAERQFFPTAHPAQAAD